jgi:hypothetical protein
MLCVQPTSRLSVCLACLARCGAIKTSNASRLNSIPWICKKPDAGDDLVDSLNFELGATGRPERVLAREVGEEGHDLFMDTWFWVADEDGWW